jgi:hypothetical protein
MIGHRSVLNNGSSLAIQQPSCRILPCRLPLADRLNFRTPFFSAELRTFKTLHHQRQKYQHSRTLALVLQRNETSCHDHPESTSNREDLGFERHVEVCVPRSIETYFAKSMNYVVTIGH